MDTNRVKCWRKWALTSGFLVITATLVGFMFFVGWDIHKANYFFWCYMVREGDRYDESPPELTGYPHIIRWIGPPSDYTGIWITWHSNGQVMFELKVKNGVAVYSKEFYRDGTFKSEGPLNQVAQPVAAKESSSPDEISVPKKSEPEIPVNLDDFN